jgi:hypothetical protein
MPVHSYRLSPWNDPPLPSLLDFPAGLLAIMALQTAKRDLRKRMRETLSALSNASIVQQCWFYLPQSSASQPMRS